uniref:Uncharacterized protein n=1 Tax=Strigamia maritima TaxID=126957 RepID=T1IN85_STRMM
MQMLVAFVKLTASFPYFTLNAVRMLLLGFIIPPHNPLFDALRNDLSEDCIEHNRIDVDKVFLRLQNCLTDVIKPLFSGVLQNGRFMGPFVEALCDKADLLVCLVKAEDEVKICLTREKQEYFEYTLRSMAASIIYGCKKGGQSFKSLFSKEGSACMFKAQPHFPHCAKLLPREAKNRTLNFWFQEKHCIQQGQFADCIVRVLIAKCDDDKVANVFHGLFKAMFVNTPCEQYYDNNTNNLKADMTLLGTLMLILTRVA